MSEQQRRHAHQPETEHRQGKNTLDRRARAARTSTSGNGSSNAAQCGPLGHVAVVPGSARQEQKNAVRTVAELRIKSRSIRDSEVIENQARAIVRAPWRTR